MTFTRRSPEDVVAIEVVQYNQPNWWYVRAVERGGKVWHWEPFLSRWAADKAAEVLWARLRYEGQLAEGAEKRRPVAYDTLERR